MMLKINAKFLKTGRGSRLGIPLLLLGLAVMLGGCEETKRALGQTKSAPDEFAVYQRAPLSLPPNYNLRPPSPGENRPQSVNPRDRARAALGQTSKVRPRITESGKPNLSALSPGELSVLRITGALNVTSEIRRQVNQESSILADGADGLTDTMMFWRQKPEFGVEVDAANEKKRIQANKSAGVPLNEGNTPIVMRKKKALLDGVFR
ncbi:MAG: DUF3035 domain-containing protein [Rhodospirillaceae bacterium]|jgi:hypothetical protein|nr:DUF3035 domain-containing protein [Rhodospirillaceae bacterium]MBT3886540.1 DUF3035 domain-containing protein [Rhodospirillaceae bacterium]MBT4116137.1 DUF3035 domain-containing protein [Rhodospirillaceae bacterium]MBT4673480.1 DUF3035 domain-containing protein [Rhodospirillaceae bacterium]MBT5178145.1 DUF3035 domain-containing protein [Rhodospirillaceae bacterium]